MYVTSNVDSARIVERAAMNDQQAWAELVGRYGGMLRAIATGFRLNRSDADDAIQTTWLDLVRTIGNLRSHDRIAGWLSTTMRRNCMRILQRPRWEMLSDVIEETAADTAANVEDAVLAAEQARHLWDVIEDLPDRQARLLHVLFAEDGLSYIDIADALSMPVGAIGPVRQRALRTLARMLATEADAA
jgi:RNA polymerase sigma factor (sigma-70 family)